MRFGLVKQNNGVWNKTHPDRRTISEWEVLYELAVLMEGMDQISIEDALNGENGIIKIYQITIQNMYYYPLNLKKQLTPFTMCI